MKPEKKVQRRVRRIESVGQKSLALFEEAQEGAQGVAPRVQGAIRFEDPDPKGLRLGDQRLDEHLQAMGLRDALVVRQLLSELDWSAFVNCYSALGRPGYAPWLMAGVVLFGLMRGVSSLRELERFARGDLECMWVSGGITPDHSLLGRFIVRHERELSGALFESIVQMALKRTGTQRDRLAGDGTVLEAMSSRFALIKREALQAKRAQEQAQEQQASQRTAQQESEQETEQAEPGEDEDEGEGEPQVQQPDAHEPHIQESAEPSALQRACQVLDERAKARAIVVDEPEAGLLRLKNGRGSRPAYQAAVLANAARVVVDAQVHSTSEQAALLELLQQLDSTRTYELLLDAGFNMYEILELAVQREISVLCPEQAESAYGDEAEQPGEPGESGKGYYPLRLFRYVEEGDYYVCPAGQEMHPCRRHPGNAAQDKRPYVQYATPACSSCERRSKCTKREVRTVQRTEGRELKEALRQVMEQPQAKRVFAQRKAMVEPVFSALRERQGLNRFRRRGLSRVRLEFRLHLMAYNLGRALAHVRKGIRAVLLRAIGLIRAALRDLDSPPARLREPDRSSRRWLLGPLPA